MGAALGSEFADLIILKDEPLARYTSARIGGPADRLVAVDSISTLIGAVREAQNQGLTWCVLGSGSNVLVADAGVRGLVIVNRARHVVIEGERVYAESGANLSSLARSCFTRGLAGLEWAVSVPGTVGVRWSVTPVLMAAILRAASPVRPYWSLMAR